MDWHEDRIEAIEEVIESHMKHFIDENKQKIKTLTLERKKREKARKLLPEKQEKKLLNDQKILHQAITNVMFSMQKDENDGKIRILI